MAYYVGTCLENTYIYRLWLLPPTIHLTVFGFLNTQKHNFKTNQHPISITRALATLCVSPPPPALAPPPF